MISPVTAPADADIEAVVAYARHVASCSTCKQANTDDQLCAAGGALWDEVTDDDPTDAAGICAACFCAAPFHRMGCVNQ